MPFNCLALRYRSYAEIERCLCSFIQNVFQEQVMHSKNILMLLFIEKILLLICQKLGCSLSYFTSNNGRLALLTRSATYAQCPLMFSSTCLTANWSSSWALPGSRKWTEEVSWFEPNSGCPGTMLSAEPFTYAFQMLASALLLLCRRANMRAFSYLLHLFSKLLIYCP